MSNTYTINKDHTAHHAASENDAYAACHVTSASDTYAITEDHAAGSRKHKTGIISDHAIYQCDLLKKARIVNHHHSVQKWQYPQHLSRKDPRSNCQVSFKETMPTVFDNTSHNRIPYNHM
jgi:hypothetical protein